MLARSSQAKPPPHSHPHFLGHMLVDRTKPPHYTATSYVGGPYVGRWSQAKPLTPHTTLPMVGGPSHMLVGDRRRHSHSHPHFLCRGP
jgi:hypothetical protein